MCFLMEDDDGHAGTGLNTNNDSKRHGQTRWQFHAHHKWIIPRKPLLLVLAMSLFLFCMGILFMIIGGAITSIGLKVVGGLLFGFGLLGLIVCFGITIYAYFFYGTRDQSTQTTESTWSDEMTLDAAGYSSVGRPSALKSPDSTLKRNGALGVKKVTLAPELGDYGVLPINNIHNINNNSNNGKANSMKVVNNQRPHRLPSTGSSSAGRANSMPRTGYVDGSTVGTGGIKITHVDSTQPFPSPASSVSYGGGSAGHYYSTGGDGSTISGGSLTDTYASPRSIQLSFDSGNSGSQYSTLRSIPVTHLGHGQKPSTSSIREVEYASVNKQPGTINPGQVAVRVEHLPAKKQHSSVSSQSHGLMAHVQMGQDALNQSGDDRYKDYDNTVEHTSLVTSTPHHQEYPSGNVSYHEKQMQFQRHQRHPQQNQPDLYAPRQINSYSLQRQYTPNPFTFQQQHQQQQQPVQQQQLQERQMQQYKMHHEQEKKQQQHQLQMQLSKSSAASSARSSMVDDVFQPQPLVYPSARRPMTFDQVTSSKMSVYDNVLADNLKERDEIE